MLKFWSKNLASVTSMMLISVLLLGIWDVKPVNAEAQPLNKDDNTYRIVSLGDSLTVGYEPGVNKNMKPYGFVDRLLEQGLIHGRTEVVNLGINGLTTEGLHRYVQAVVDEKAISPRDIQSGLKDPRAGKIGAKAAQAKTLLANADVITVTIGGNDMLGLLNTSYTASAQGFSALVQQVIKTYTDNVTSVVHNLHRINPDALIVLADQYQPLPKIADKKIYSKMLEAAERFTGLVDEMAESFNKDGIDVKVAHVAKEFVGSEMAMTHILKKDIHPNQPGYEAMARVFSEVIWGEYTKLEASDPSEPMTIFVNGKELKTPYKSIMVNNKNFAAVQDIVNAVGAKSKWSNETSSLTITFEGRTVVITIGAETMKINGEIVPIDTPAFLHKVGKEHKTYAPLEAVAFGLGLDVQYSAKLRTVFIHP